MKARNALATLAISTAVYGVARGDVVFGDFQTGTAPGFGALTSSTGVQPWTAPVTGTVITAASGPLAGSNVLQLTGSESFNFGYTEAAALGFNFIGQNLRAEFLANDQLEFDWYPVPNGGSAGYSQIYNVILNSQGGGFQTIDGYGGGNESCNQFYFTGYTGTLHHIVINYQVYKDLLAGSANPDGGGWLEMAIQPNAGGGAPADMYFDNFKLSSSSGPTNAAWAVNADGNWSLATNWTPSAPNAIGAVANFGSAILQARTVTVDAAETTGTINFDNANKYTIAGTTIGNTLTLDNTIAPVGINVVSGSHDINAPLVLAKNAVITVTPSGSTLTVGSLQSSSVGITKAGAGKLVLNNARAGSLTVSTGTVAVKSGRSTSGTSNLGALSVAGGAALDLNDQDMIVNKTNTPLSTIQSLLGTGYNGGAWNGTGIQSTSANSVFNTPGAPATSLGYGDNAVLGYGPNYSGQPVDANSAIVRYTYAGDANLDGSVDTVDFGLLAANFSVTGAGAVWFAGNFNYDANVDTVDFGILAANFGLVLAGDSAGFALVPEPTGALIVPALWMLGLARHRRNKR